MHLTNQLRWDLRSKKKQEAGRARENINVQDNVDCIPPVLLASSSEWQEVGLNYFSGLLFIFYLFIEYNKLLCRFEQFAKDFVSIEVDEKTRVNFEGQKLVTDLILMDKS